MDEVGILDARNNFSALVDRAERGEEVTITRHGKPVARLVPVGTHDRMKARAAARKIRELRKGVNLGGLKIKDLVNEGRR